MTCEHCAKPLTSKRRDTRYCDATCRSAAFRQGHSQRLGLSTLKKLNEQRQAVGRPPLSYSETLATLAQQGLALKGRYRNPVYVTGEPFPEEEVLAQAVTHVGISTRRVGGRTVIAVVLAMSEAPPQPAAAPAPPAAGVAPAPAPAPAPVLDATGRAP